MSELLVLEPQGGAGQGRRLGGDVLTNPPFGTKGANQAADRDDFTIETSNKQLDRNTSPPKPSPNSKPWWTTSGKSSRWWKRKKAWKNE
jgi:hypothetical protein